MFKYLKIGAASLLLTNLSISNDISNDGQLQLPSHILDTEQSHHAVGRKYKCIVDSDIHHESRDWLVNHTAFTGKYKNKVTAAPLPAIIDLRPKCPPIYNQGNLGSCTANAINGAMQFDMIAEKLPNAPMLSRLFTYWNERNLEGSVNFDAGASLSDGLKVVCTLGVCSESLWAYNDGPSQFKIKPTANCYEEAKQHVDLDNLQLARVSQDLTTLKSVLAASTPFVFGICVYTSFESQAVAKTGIVPMPNLRTERLLGGHALMACGYSDQKQAFLIRNSWGTGWGMGGYFWLPYAYMTSKTLAFDFWKISNVGVKK